MIPLGQIQKALKLDLSEAKGLQWRMANLSGVICRRFDQM